MLAARQLWNVGPIAPLTEAVRRIGPGSWTHTASHANLTLWRHAGDLLNETEAGEAVRYCLTVLADETPFVARTNPSFSVEAEMLDALVGLLSAADDVVHREVATHVAGLGPVTDPLIAGRLSSLASRLRSTALVVPDDWFALREAATTQPDRKRSAMILGALVDHDHVARELLMTRVSKGDTDALEALGDVRQLDIEIVRRLLAQDSDLIEAIIAESAAGTFALRSRDPARSLTVLSIWFPGAAQWDTLLRFLGDEQVPGQHKRGACLVLARNAQRLPEAVKMRLGDLAPGLSGISSIEASLPPMLPSLGGAGVDLAAVLGAFDDQVLSAKLASLLTGSRQERRDAAILIGRAGRIEHTAALVALVSDAYSDVRSAAAYALAFRVASVNPSEDPLAVEGLRLALTDPGARVSLAIAEGIAAADSPTSLARELAASLVSHPSALVREAAGRTVVTGGPTLQQSVPP